MTKGSYSIINDLLLEVDDETLGEQVRAHVPLRKVEEIPDALVLCVITTICKFCSTKWEHPNPQVLGRYSRNHKRIEKWSSLFEQLPRERLEIREEATTCMNCFESCVLRTGDVEGTGS